MTSLSPNTGSKTRVYKLPFLSKVAWFIADHLPNRVRAAVFIEAYMSLDEHYESVEQHHKDHTTLKQAVGGIRIETLRREAFKDGLKAKLGDKS